MQTLQILAIFLFLYKNRVREHIECIHQWMKRSQRHPPNNVMFTTNFIRIQLNTMLTMGTERTNQKRIDEQEEQKESFFPHCVCINRGKNMAANGR